MVIKIYINIKVLISAGFHGHGQLKNEYVFGMRTASGKHLWKISTFRLLLQGAYSGDLKEHGDSTYAAKLFEMRPNPTKFLFQIKKQGFIKL